VSVSIRRKVQFGALAVILGNAAAMTLLPSTAAYAAACGQRSTCSALTCGQQEACTSTLPAGCSSSTAVACYAGLCAGSNLHVCQDQ
jgi:hypothetical protein